MGNFLWTPVEAFGVPGGFARVPGGVPAACPAVCPKWSAQVCPVLCPAGLRVCARWCAKDFCGYSKRDSEAISGPEAHAWSAKLMDALSNEQRDIVDTEVSKVVNGGRIMCFTITLFLEDNPMLSDTTVRKNAWDFKQSIEKILGENHNYHSNNWICLPSSGTAVSCI